MTPINYVIGRCDQPQMRRAKIIAHCCNDMGVGCGLCSALRGAEAARSPNTTHGPTSGTIHPAARRGAICRSGARYHGGQHHRPA